jgi:hypothetical protein
LSPKLTKFSRNFSEHSTMHPWNLASIMSRSTGLKCAGRAEALPPSCRRGRYFSFISKACHLFRMFKNLTFPVQLDKRQWDAPIWEPHSACVVRIRNCQHVCGETGCSRQKLAAFPYIHVHFLDGHWTSSTQAVKARHALPYSHSRSPVWQRGCWSIILLPLTRTTYGSAGPVILAVRLLTLGPAITNHPPPPSPCILLTAKWTDTCVQRTPQGNQVRLVGP